VRFVEGDYREPDTFVRLAKALGGATRPLHYLAIPPSLFPTVIERLPEKDGSRRFYTDISTAATGDFAAVFAQAARIYRPYDSALADSYLAAARLSYDFLKASATIKPNLDMFGTGNYDSGSGDFDNRAWAAAEMWETTGEDAFLVDFEGTPKAPKAVADNFDYGDVLNMGSFTYILSARPGRDQTVVDAMTASVLASAERLATRAGGAAFGRAIENYW